MSTRGRWDPFLWLLKLELWFMGKDIYFCRCGQSCTSKRSNRGATISCPKCGKTCRGPYTYEEL